MEVLKTRKPVFLIAILCIVTCLNHLNTNDLFIKKY